MSELFYKAMRCFGGVVFRVASDPIVLHRERADRPGAYLLAANHASVFDAALLIAATPRVIHWLSIVELFRHPFTRWFLSSMLALPLDRGRADTMTVRKLVKRLRAGKVAGLFPEGELRGGADSVLAGGRLKDGVAKLAELASVPVLPCVIVGGEKFYHWANWLPLFRTRWAVCYGEPIGLGPDGRDALVRKLEIALRALHEEVKAYV